MPPLKRAVLADAEFWHPFAHVKGNQNIAGYFQFWCTLHRKIDVNIFGFSAPLRPPSAAAAADPV